MRCLYIAMCSKTETVVFHSILIKNSLRHAGWSDKTEHWAFEWMDRLFNESVLLYGWYAQEYL